MKSGFRLMVLVVVALVSTSAWAMWDPDGDASLLFNMNFESYSNAGHTATDAKAGIVGTLVDYNTINYNVFGETSAPGLGHDANFASIFDIGTGSAVSSGTPGPNDVKLAMPTDSYIFDLGNVSFKHTWAFWFNVPNLDSGTIIRHASLYSDPCSLYYDSSYANAVWEIRIYSGKMMFYHKDNCLRMETASSLSDLGLTINTWHSAAVVIDRTSTAETLVPTIYQSAKIYVDGLEVPIIVTSVNTSTMDVDVFHDSPIWIGAGEREFDGLLDDVRLYNRVLTATEVSILNQPDRTIPAALAPIPRSTEVILGTGLSWEPVASASTQDLYFGTDPNSLTLIKSGGVGMNSATSGEIGGPLSLGTTYYWYIKTDGSNGPVWSFTVETGKALIRFPADGAEDINGSFVDVNWNTPSAATYTVYLSNNRSLVETNDVSVRIANGITDHNMIATTGGRGLTYYWKVNCTYPSAGTIPGDIWSFRTEPYELIFNTSSLQKTYADHVISGMTCVVHGSSWSDPCATGSLSSDGVAEFNFPSGFNYDRRYDIVVIPTYRATDISYDANFPTPLAIHVTGNFYFDGRVQIAGDDLISTSTASTFARCGGFPGPKQNQDTSIFPDRTVPIPDYWTSYTMPGGYHGRFGTIGGAKVIYVPTDLAKSTWGPGVPVGPPYKGGGGGGYGGLGGDAGRGYFFGVDTAGPTYGDKEVPVPFGGSAGGAGSGGGCGAAGGGGIEIAATGNVVLDVNSQIRAFGGSQLCPAINYPNGGGAGGSVRIIAGGSVTNKGYINVNGGMGGKANQANNTGGGGGGGRVAIFYGTTYDGTSGVITTLGGARGTFNGTQGLGQPGKSGTVFTSNSSPKKASAPTPVNGDPKALTYPDPCTSFQLKWYSGYGGATDRVYCDNNPNPTTLVGTVAATRGQHSVTITASSGRTYYWKVVTDTTVSSDAWSFKTVTWRCRQYDGATVAPIDPNHVSGPEWDMNHDCVVDMSDLVGFGLQWRDEQFEMYTLDLLDLDRFADEWLYCFDRTNNGCNSYNHY